jgi:RES domain-containing protein
VITAWRIVKSDYADSAFDGESARIAGGRWNSPGVRVIYTSESAALAALEVLVHLGRSRSLPEYVIFYCTFSESLVSDIDSATLPTDWRTFPAPASLRFLGDTWAKSRSSAVMRVPSAVIEMESNYLLNPEHRDFGQLKISQGRPFPLDFRLLPH